MRNEAVGRARIECCVSLWPHQLSGFSALRDAYAEGHSRVLCVAPCGSGKTRFAAKLCWSSLSLGNRILFVVHNGELVRQSVDALEAQGITTGIIQSGKQLSPLTCMQVGTVQTLRRRDLPWFDFVIFDEAHLHQTASSKIIIEKTRPEFILGLTATPTMLSGKSLGELYTRLVQLVQPSVLIKAGILMEPLVYAPSEPDTSDVPTKGLDFKHAELSHVSNTPRLVGDIAESYAARLPHYPPAVLFAVDRRHSLACRDRLRAVGFIAEHLDGETPKEERDSLLARFRAGQIHVLCNVEILTTGFNHPPLECVIIARPTQSEALHIQMCSRPLRSWEGKRRPTILDHSGNTRLRHGFAHADREWSNALTVKRRVAMDRLPSLTQCKNCFALFAGGGACPGCGVQPTVIVKDTKHSAGELTLVTRAPTPDEKRKRFLELCDTAIKSGLSRYWVKSAFKREFKHIPQVKLNEWPKKLPMIASIEQANIDRTVQKRGMSPEQREAMMRRVGLLR